LSDTGFLKDINRKNPFLYSGFLLLNAAGGLPTFVTNQSRAAENGIEQAQNIIIMETTDIVKNASNITLEPASANATGFCQVWPEAKNGLTLLRDMIKNPIAKAAINIVIAAGDGVASQVCH
jgi:hypothetical protein